MRRFLFLALTAGLLSPAATNAETYDALCRGVKCKIRIDTQGVSGPAGFIPSHRVAQWYTSGAEENNQAMAVVGASTGAFAGMAAGGIATCWTGVLCPFGLLGGMVGGIMEGSKVGTSANFFFTVIGYNQQGIKTIQNFNFINKKPVGRLIQQLPLVTNLGMGELRSLKEIKEGDKRQKITGKSQERLPDQLEN